MSQYARGIPFSIRMTHARERELIDYAKKLGISKTTLAHLFIDAGLEAIREHEGKLVLPVEFKVKHEPKK